MRVAQTRAEDTGEEPAQLRGPWEGFLSEAAGNGDGGRRHVGDLESSLGVLGPKSRMVRSWVLKWPEQGAGGAPKTGPERSAGTRTRWQGQRPS